MELKGTHIITSLHADGAQQALTRILKALGHRAQRMSVISLSDEGSIGGPIRAQGVSVQSLGMRAGWTSMCDLWRLRQTLKKSRPDVVITWLYHGDLIGGLAAKLAGRLPVVWNVRRSGVPDSGTKRATQVAVAACRKLARRLPTAVVFCSERSRREHVDRGYPAARTNVVPNGFDLSVFRPRPDAAARLRSELNLPPAAKVVGHFGRFHPAKDHATLLDAAARVATADSDVHFALCGRGVDGDNPGLATMLQRFAIAHRCHLLGHRADVAQLMAGMDLVVSSSRTEGFPNAVGEALASGVPCVGTDVGETRRIIGPGGKVVPPRDPRLLAAVCRGLLERGPAERERLGELGRRHVAEHFEISHLAEKHLQIWRAAAQGESLGAAESGAGVMRRRAA